MIAKPPPVLLYGTGFDTWFSERFATQDPVKVEGLRNILQEAWTAAIRWVAAQQSGTLPEAPAVVDTVSIPRQLLQEVLLRLTAVADLPDDQQSPELLALISQLREILE